MAFANVYHRDLNEVVEMLDDAQTEIFGLVSKLLNIHVGARGTWYDDAWEDLFVAEGLIESGQDEIGRYVELLEAPPPYDPDEIVALVDEAWSLLSSAWSPADKLLDNVRKMLAEIIPDEDFGPEIEAWHKANEQKEEETP